MRLFKIRTLPLTLLIAVALVVGGAVAHGQRPQGGGTPGPMLVDFSAVMADGRPATDLTAADLSIKVGGKVRTVSDLQLKRIAAPAAAAAGAAEATAPAAGGGSAPAPFSTNEASAAAAPAAAAPAGRAFLIVVDNESLAPGTEVPVKAAIENLLKDLTPADRVAYSTAPKDTAQVGFGSSLAAVRQAVSGLRGIKGVSTTDPICRTTDTLNLLKALIGQAPGGETTTAVVVIAGGLSTPGSSKTTTGGNCNLVTDDFNSVTSTLSAARANLYVVQGDSAVGRDAGMENLASVGGGSTASVLRVANEGFAPRVLQDSSTYWVATLAPDPSDKPGVSQRLELKTTKEGVTIRTRPEVMMSRPGNAAGAGAAAGKAGTPLKDIASQQASYTDLQLRAYAFSQRGAGDKMNVLVQAEPVDPSVKLTAMKIGFFDAAGKGTVVDATQVATYPITTGLPVGAGQYRIRVAATDSTGKSGAVDIKLDTSPVPAGPFKISGLMLLLTKDGTNSPRLQFTEGDTVTVMFEMYGILSAAPMIVGFEYAPVEDLTKAKTFRPSGQQATSEPDKFQIFGQLPAGLAPGDYVIRGIVQQQGAEKGQSVRTIRILKKP
ncbi:MAG TPA: hypothetical protein VFV78_11660 [Vicinamibacterales bacterium]|nr:hypothetical protein [Vicinamibacterales bacterium]